MKHLSLAVYVLLILLFIPTLCNAAGEKATKEDCVTLAKKAAAMINTDGLEAALSQINDRKGPFVLKDTYVFCMTTDTVKIIGHPYVPEWWRSLSQKDYLDPNGTLVFQQFIKALENKDEAWINYAQYRPREEKPSMKTSYIMKVPGQNLIVGAGVYD